MTGTNKRIENIPAEARGPGRPKGSPNRTSAAIKEAILNAFEKVNGEEYLVKLAQTDPRTFCTLLGKVLPTTMVGDPDNPVNVVSRVEYVIVDPNNAGS